MSDPDREPVTLDIYLRSGQTISLSVLDWSLKKGGLNGELRELSWTMADSTQMPYVNLTEVVAVVARVPA